MESFLRWLSENPVIADILLAVLIIIVLFLILMFVVAFKQGREITFYPPRIGSKPNVSELGNEKAKDVNAEKPKPKSLNLSANKTNQAPDKSSHIASKKRIAEKDVVSLIKRFNDDFCKVLDSRDLRYLKASTTEEGMVKEKKSMENMLDFMEEKKMTSTHPVEINLVTWQEGPNNKVEATTDEVWEEIYSDGHKSKVSARNIYEVLLVGDIWLIDSCEVLRPQTQKETNG